ncbi:MAG: hypothetical protein ACRDKL_04015 [Solirubrobacteraceae bacterium]
MSSPFMTVAVARAMERVPGLRRLPLARLVILAEVAILAKAHLDRLSPRERRQLLTLLRDAKCMPRTLSSAERREFEDLIAKLEPQLFANTAAEKFSPLRGFGRRRS